MIVISGRDELCTNMLARQSRSHHVELSYGDVKYDIS